MIFFSAAINSEGKEIFLRDIWPTREEIQAVERTFVIPSMFKEVYEKIEVQLEFRHFYWFDQTESERLSVLSVCRK